MTVTKQGKVVKKVELTKQHPQKTNRVNLSCARVPSDLVREARISNNTDQAVPKGKTIHWETDDGDKGTRTLESPLAPGESFDVLISKTEVPSFSCRAWYIGRPLKFVAKGKVKAVD